MTPFMGVRISCDMFARNSAFRAGRSLRLNSLADLSNSSLADTSLGRALGDLLLEVLPVPLESIVAVLNAHEHAVEGVDEVAQLILRVFLGANRVVVVRLRWSWPCLTSSPNRPRDPP